MKKISIILLAMVVLSTVMVGCGQKKPDPKTNSSDGSGISYKGKVFATQEELIAFTDKEYEEAYEKTRIYKDHQIVGCWDYVDPQADEPTGGTWTGSAWTGTIAISYDEFLDTGRIIYNSYSNEIDGWKREDSSSFSIEGDILSRGSRSYKEKMSFITDDKGRECMILEYYEEDKLKTSKYIKYLGEKAPETK